MISVKPIKPAVGAGGRRVAAKISCRWWSQEKLWFDVPENFTPSLVDSCNAWLTALLPLAFERGEDLRICGPVDPVLLQNMEQTQQVWARWFPERKPVRIIAETAAEVRRPAGDERIGCFFSAGVDSFYSLLHFDATQTAGRGVDDLIYVWGYDIAIADRRAIAGKMAALTRVAGQLNKNIVPLATNLRETRLRKLDWGLHMHGPALGVAGLLLGARYQSILISTSQIWDSPVPWGTHPATPPLMSSGHLRFNYYGADPSRFEKTAYLARSPIALQNLHVCWVNRDEKNCGRCEKCFRTLLTLEALGCRSAATSFPQEHFSIDRLKDLKLIADLSLPFYEEISVGARSSQRLDIMAAVDACIAASKP